MKEIRYAAPCILGRVEVDSEGPSMLAASLVEFVSEVNTIQQDVDEINLSENVFHHEWE